MNPNLLIIEDEASIASLLKYDFKNLGYNVTVAKDGQEALECFEMQSYDVMIVDWMLPHYSGIDLVKMFRAKGSEALIMMLTAKDEETDILEAFEAGVDDYMSKPFSPRELSARISAHLKRFKRQTQDNVIKIEDLMIDLEKRSAYINQVKISLTKKEFDLLYLFLKNFDRVLSRDTILNDIWNFDYDGDSRIVDVHVFKLRTKLDSSRIKLESERGVGYVAQRK